VRGCLRFDAPVPHSVGQPGEFFGGPARDVFGGLARFECLRVGKQLPQDVEVLRLLQPCQIEGVNGLGRGP